MKNKLTHISLRHPWIVIGLAVVITAFFAAQFPKIRINTDPQDMLKQDEPTRKFDEKVKDEFALHDMIAVGVVEDGGAFKPDLLNRIYKITGDIEKLDGVIVDDILAPSTVDDIKQGAGGTLIIEPLMNGEISTQQEADYILSRIKSNPVLRGKLASDDGKAIALFIPIENKNLSKKLADEITEITRKHGGPEKYHIAGLPIAEDSFGSQMFRQMAVAAPATFVVIFLLLLMFFRNVRIIIAPMVVAVMAVVWSMGLLILTGNTVHIMASMIPIFLIPISVLNSIYIISEFHAHYKKYSHKDNAIAHAINELFVPMLFVSTTASIGFFALAVTPIPPVRVFGVFVGFGTMVAWFLSLTINPAFAKLISAKTLHRFANADDTHSLLARILHGLRNLARRQYRIVIAVAAVLVIVSAVGLSMIVVNDNPVKWFKKSHPIRQADMAMNGHLAGTYMNYLVFESDDADVMKRPEVERYIESVQHDLEKEPIVGATTGIPDVVKKVRYELFGADSTKMVIPSSQDEVAQMLFMFEMSGGDPGKLFKFVTPDYSSANVWVQLKNGDNQAVRRVVDRAEEYIEEHPVPEGVRVRWAGLPYVNIVWQELMVGGMREALLVAFGIVFIMMVSLFRSLRWGIISMLPLSLTVMAIYAFIGFIGKPYDMPISILSSLTLGLSVDFAIQFIQRMRTIYSRNRDFNQTFHDIFEGVGRAIARNVLVISIGFVPMLFSDLVPYVTVGAFFLAIMLVSGFVTMLLLPAITIAFQRSLFRPAGHPMAKPLEVRSGEAQ